MAQQLTQLTIFFSGTSVVEAECAALKAVIEELNRMLAKSRKILLKVVSWPNDFRPGVNQDVQSEINRQIQGQYDIYIGVLGSRFGTPTQRAGSGTEEEFQIAVSQFLQDTTSIRVLFYFKRANQDPFTIDTKQLIKVHKFRSDLSQKGVIYRDFKDTANFVEIVKEHLWNLISDEWNGNVWKLIELPSQRDTNEINTQSEQKTEEKATSVTEIIAESEDVTLVPEETGYFDLMEEFYTAVESMRSSLGNMTEYTVHIGEQFNVHTESANNLMRKYGDKPKIGGSRDAQKYLTRAKEVVDNARSDLETYTGKMRPQISALKTDLQVMLNRFRNVYIFANEKFETPEEQKQKDAGALHEFIKTMVTLVDEIMIFQESITNLPALTTKFNKARKHATTVLRELIAEIKIAIDQANNILKQIGVTEN
ncbi:MAG: hypothetical protein PHW73_01480, partial [Atribacterota bacterium]|nr:hypothetical protein [Atribacterota bacterium]